MAPNDPSSDKPLRSVSFVIHATRGVVRDPSVRRKTMFVVVLVAIVLLFSGSTFLQPALNPHEHPFAFILFWLVCGWFALTAILLAAFDLLMVRLDARRDHQRLREDLKTGSSLETPDE